MEFVVDRSKWRCGGNGPHSAGKGTASLLNIEGYQCCMGFVCEQLGVSRKELLGVLLPSNLTWFHKVPHEIFLGDKKTLRFYDWNCPAHLQSYAFTINDNPDLTKEEREAKLIQAFHEFGHTLKFVGEY